MGINWMSMLTIFLAIVLAEIFVRNVFAGGSIGGHPDSVGSRTHNPAEKTNATIVYTSKIDQYIHEKYPSAAR